MTRTTFQIAAIAVAAVLLVATVGLTVKATAGESGDQAGGFLAHFHQWAQSLHGGGHHEAMTGLIEQLELTPEQRAHLERVHEIIGAGGGEEPGSTEALHDRLVAQLEAGEIDPGEIHGLIDQHVEQIRATAHAATDELLALVNGLDGRQREILLDHLRGAGATHHGHGHGHGH